MLQKVFVPPTLLLVFLSGCASKQAATADPSAAAGINNAYATDEGRARALAILEGEGRDKYQKPDEVIRNLS